MPKSQYGSLSTKDLAEVYFTTKANYGKIEGDLLAEIESRGGEKSFLEQLQKAKALDAEKARIWKEVAGLMSDHSDPVFIKKLIHSDLLTESELSQCIDTVHQKLTAHKFNIKVDAKTVGASVVGILIATVIGAVVSGAQLIFSGQFFYLSLVLVYFLSWLVIRFITKKNAANIVVLLSSIVATVLGPLLAFLIMLK
jgi:hypothetical protein